MFPPAVPFQKKKKNKERTEAQKAATERLVEANRARASASAKKKKRERGGGASVDDA